jgi:glutathione peroxidase
MRRSVGLLTLCLALCVADNSIYKFNALDIFENNTSLEKYRGRVLVIFNAASEWGLADTNYNQLEALYRKYEQHGLSVAAFPCNQFSNQEPGTDAEILEHVREKYNVTFDMYHKINVNGASAIPLYQYLRQMQPGGFPNGTLQWNYTKFLINRHGVPIKRYEPIIPPNFMEGAIAEELAQTVPAVSDDIV